MSGSPAQEPVASPRVPLGAMLRAVALGVRDLASRNQAILTMAAAMAYRTIFSLIPLLLIALLTLRLFKGDDESLVRTVIQRLMDQIGLGQISAGGDGAGASGVQEWVTRLVADFKGINFTGIGLVSAAMLIYAAMSLLMGLEDCFNRVYAVARGRTPLARVAQYWLVITLGPLLVYASFFVGDQFRALAAGMSGVAGEWLAGTLVGAAGYAVTVLISTLLLFVLYLAVPNTRVRWRPALLGALAAGVLLELAKLGFQVYAAGAGLRSMYGALALLPLFMLWMYVTWVLVLGGLRVSYLIEHRAAVGAGQRLEEYGGGSRVPIVEPAALVAVGVELARRFEQGRPADAVTLAAAAGLPPEQAAIAAAVADQLVLRGVAVRVEPIAAAARSARQQGKGPTWSLARPAHAIAMRQVLEAVFAVIPGPTPPGGLVASARSAQLDALGTRTLAGPNDATAAAQLSYDDGVRAPDAATGQPTQATPG